MARYHIRVKITSTDPTNTNFQSFENDEAISIIREFYADGRIILTEDTINSDHRIVENSFTDLDTYLDLRSQLDVLGNYKRSDVTVQVLSEG